MGGTIIEEKMKLIKKDLFLLLDKKIFTFLILISSLSSSLFVYAPVRLNNIIKKIGKIDSKDIIFIIALLVLAYIVQYFSVFIKNNLIQDYNTKAIPYLYRMVLKLNYDKYINLGSTAIQDLAFNSSDAYANYYAGVLPDLFINLATIIATIAIAFTLNKLAALLIFIILPIQFFGFKALNKKLAERSVKLRESSSVNFKNINSISSQVDFIK